MMLAAPIDRRHTRHSRWFVTGHARGRAASLDSPPSAPTILARTTQPTTSPPPAHQSFAANTRDKRAS